MKDIEKRVLELIGEDPENPDVFVDTVAGIEPVRTSINDAIQEIVALTGSHKRDYYIPLRAGQRFYRMVPNQGVAGWISDAWVNDKKHRLEQTSLGRLTKFDHRWMRSSSFPVSYFQVGVDTIGVYPKPSASTDVLRLTVVEIPDPYTADGDRLRIKREFEYAVVHYAVAEYWAGRGDAREATKHTDLYLEVLGMRDMFDQSPQQMHHAQTGKEPYPMVTT